MSPLLFKRLSDESLGSRLASGEAAAFDELYRRYVNRLAAYGSHLLGDAVSGDDVAQATMLKAYAALREGRVPEKMKPWLYRIAHNTAIDLVVRRRELPSDDLPEAPTADREPFAGALVEALATLPDRQRRVYILREVHGLRIDETAAELGLTASQVEQSLFAARNRLAEQLVFGDRLNCVTVQRLAAGPLDGPERRALKTHLRACHECRRSLGLRGHALSWFPNPVGLEWLRGLGAGLIGGGAPVVAKVGAVVATATIVGGGTVAVEHAHFHRVQHAALKGATVKPAARATPRASFASAPVAVSAATAAPVQLKRRSSHDAASSEQAAKQVAEHDGRAAGDGKASSDGGGGSASKGSEGDTSSDGGGRSPDGESPHSGHGSPGMAPTATIEKQDMREHDSSSSSDHSGKGSGDSGGSGSGRTETQPAETTPAEPQDPPKDTTTTTTTTTTSPVTPPGVPVVTVP